MKARCSCGAYCRPCHKCGNVPQAAETRELTDWHVEPIRAARIGKRARELKCGRFGVSAFIDRECKGVV